MDERRWKTGENFPCKNKRITREKNQMIIAWFSCGVTSAVACKIALSLYEDVQIYYIETGSGHTDNARFLADCEKWYEQPIHTIAAKSILT